MTVENVELTGMLSPGDVQVSIAIYPDRTIVTDRQGSTLACATIEDASTHLDLENPHNPATLSRIATSDNEDAIPIATLDTFGVLRGANPTLSKGRIQEKVFDDGTVELIFSDGENHFRLGGDIPNDPTVQAVALAAGLLGAEKLAA